MAGDGSRVADDRPITLEVVADMVDTKIGRVKAVVTTQLKMRGNNPTSIS